MNELHTDNEKRQSTEDYTLRLYIYIYTYIYIYIKFKTRQSLSMAIKTKTVVMFGEWGIARNVHEEKVLCDFISFISLIYFLIEG